MSMPPTSPRAELREVRLVDRAQNCASPPGQGGAVLRVLRAHNGSRNER